MLQKLERREPYFCLWGGGGGLINLQRVWSFIVWRSGSWRNRPFYSCVLSDLAFEWKWGWSWPCFDKDPPAFHVIYQTRERVFHQDIQTRRSRIFLTEFEEFGYLMKHSFEFLIWLLKPIITLGEIQSKSLQNFMPIRIRYPNHRHGSDFLCFLFMNY